MAGDLLKHNNNSQSGIDVKTPFLFGLKAFFRNNKNLFPFLYFLVMVVGTWIFASIVSWGIYVFLVVVIGVPVAIQIRSFIDPNAFASEEHVEIITDLARQGNKDIGTQEIIEGQSLFFPENKKDQSVKASIEKPIHVKVKRKGEK